MAREWLSCSLMKSGPSIWEHQRLDTHLNRTRVFTGNWYRMSEITSDGKLAFRTRLRLGIIWRRLGLAAIDKTDKAFFFPFSIFWNLGLWVREILVLKLQTRVKNEKG